jgi:hypothetical protein
MNEGEKPLTQASRIYFGIHHPVLHKVKAKDLGYVLPDDTARFLGYYAMEVANGTRQAAEVTAEASEAPVTSFIQQSQAEPLGDYENQK